MACFHYLIFIFYFNSNTVTYSVILVSGVQYSNATFLYHTCCSSQVHSLIPITVSPLSPPTSPQVTISLFFRAKNLFLGLPLFNSPSFALLFCFLNSTNEGNHMVFVFLCKCSISQYWYDLMSVCICQNSTMHLRCLIHCVCYLSIQKYRNHSSYDDVRFVILLL